MTIDQCDKGDCNFEPRYNIIPPSDQAINALVKLNYEYGDQDRKYIESLTTKEYVGDICLTCGRFVSPNQELQSD